MFPPLALQDTAGRSLTAQLFIILLAKPSLLLGNSIRNEGGRAPNNKRKEYKKRQVDADSQINQDVGSKAQNNNCNMKGKGVEEIRSSANNFSILNSLPKDNDQEIRILKGRMIVDEFLNKNLQPNLIESMTWSKYMIHYFKEKWESDKQNENNEGIEVEEVEDVSNSSRGTKNFIEKNEVNGIDRRDLWKVLINDNRFTHGNPWCIVGDMNVILNPKEHSCGPSIMTSDMIDCQRLLITIEVGVKIKWLCDADKNNKYFYSVLKGKSNKSKVFSLCDDSGISYKQDQIPKLFLKHFEKFLGSSYHVQDIISSETLFRRKLSPDAAEKMISSISDAEIKRAMFDIDDLKDHGPDGFTTVFFKQAWNIVGVDTCKAVKEFFSSGKMLGELNATLVLTNRIKFSLKNLVSCNQSAFIPGRHIQDNILLTQEIMKGMFCCFGFHKKMVNWIMQCVTTVAFTLNINGERVGYFRGGRGLRLGALDEFSVCFGLHPNHSKSTVFFGSMKEDECSAISVILPFVAGKLPVRYLSVPLILLEVLGVIAVENILECQRLKRFLYA
ncbi:hypothetical protein Tco_0840106 [Tanacetum coccineum]|uniref:RNA-directed DNA polymerase, eukaryota, reverse transcriptase zinc-binding domain protein n=1 Tax=Tanacetum coccineum TaxID=301880 RepID=A0ABQ5AUG6_9ASTR